MANPKAATGSAAPAQAAETVQAEGSLLDQIVESTSAGVAPDQKERGKDLIKEFVAQVLQAR